MHALCELVERVVRQDGHLRGGEHRPDIDTFVGYDGGLGASAMNLVPGRITVQGQTCKLEMGDGTGLALPAERFASHAGKAVTAGLRPEHLHWHGGQGGAALTGQARIVEPLGSDTLVVFDVAGCELQARLPPRVVRRAGDPVHVGIDPHAIHLFDPQTQRRI